MSKKENMTSVCDTHIKKHKVQKGKKFAKTAERGITMYFCVSFIICKYWLTSMLVMSALYTQEAQLQYPVQK